MFTKDFALEVKAVAEDGTFEGYASTFNGPPDSYGDIVMPGAFAETLVKHRREGTMPLMLWNHKASELPIGNWVEFAEDGKGLWAKGQADLDDPVGIRVHRALKRKALRGLSIGYEVGASEPDKKRPGVRFLKTIDLWEVSPVNFPADRRANVTDVKALDAIRSAFASGETPSLKLIEEHLRDGGFPDALATAFVSLGKGAFRQGDPGDETDQARAFLEALRRA